MELGVNYFCYFVFPLSLRDENYLKFFYNLWLSQNSNAVYLPGSDTIVPSICFSILTSAVKFNSYKQCHEIKSPRGENEQSLTPFTPL